MHFTDGIKHCMDGSDENIAYCNVRLCPENFIECNNRRCVPANQTCMDGSNSAKCDDDQFRCSNGRCIDLKNRCDRGKDRNVRTASSKFTNPLFHTDPDCPDAGDEVNCTGLENVCNFTNPKLMKCEFTSACYHSSWVCDGDNDCWDNSDEMNCGNTTCSSDHFACSNGQCINLLWRCGK